MATSSVRVKGHTRRVKGGKRVRVRGHLRRRKGRKVRRKRRR